MSKFRGMVGKVLEESEEENATPLSLMGTFNFPTTYAESSSKKFNVSNMLPSPSPPPSLRNMKRVADNTSPSTTILASPRFDYVNTFSCSPSPPNPPINPVVPNISNISFCKDIPRQPTGRGPKITPNEAKSRQKRCEWGEYEIYELIVSWVPMYERLKRASNKNKKSIWEQIWIDYKKNVDNPKDLLQIKTKIKNIEHDYRNAKDRMSRTGEIGAEEIKKTSNFSTKSTNF